MGNKVKNPRLKALEELREHSKSTIAFRLGIMDNAIELPPAGASTAFSDSLSPDGWVNAADTWTSKLADSQNDAVKEVMRGVETACTSLLSAIDSEISSIHASGLDMVDEDSDEAKWPN